MINSLFDKRLTINVAIAWIQYSSNELDQGALACSIMSHNCHDLIGEKSEVDVLQQVFLFDLVIDISHFNKPLGINGFMEGLFLDFIS